MTDNSIQVLAPFKISADRVTASDVQGVDHIDTYLGSSIMDLGAFSFDEFLEILPPDLSGGTQLVLIDGKPTYLDPSKIPPGMIASIEVSREGSMPQYGAYSSGRIINIKLKKNYRGIELGSKITGAFAGGGYQERFRVSGGEKRGKLQAFYSLDYQRTHALGADQRSFSLEQNHLDRGGRDLRLPWGYPAVIQSTSGNLNGLYSSTGQPVNVALVPILPDGLAPNPSQFLPGTNDTGVADLTAANQRRFNTAPYRMLVAPSKTMGANLGVTYTFTPRIDLSLQASYSDTRTVRTGPPPVSGASSATVVPAAYSPFAEAVEVGLVHVGFGSTRTDSENKNGQVGVRLNGKVGESWRWNSGVGYRRSEVATEANDLDQTKFSASLSEDNPDFRFDPFGGSEAEAHDELLYPSLTVIRTSNNLTQSIRFENSANGTVYEGAGGPTTLYINANAAEQLQDRVSQNAISTVTPESHTDSRGISTSATLTNRWIGAKNVRFLFRRVETQLSAGYSQQIEDSGRRDVGFGVIWSPVKSLLLRSRFSVTRETPPTTLVAAPTGLVQEVIVDPRRPSAPASNVTIVTRDTFNAESASTQRALLTASFEPAYLEGFQFAVAYHFRRRQHVLQKSFDAQDLIDNELAFPERITRAAPTDDDVALAEPGAITSVDTTPSSQGQSWYRDVEFNLEYLIPTDRFGRIRVSTFAEHVLESRYEIVPGKVFVSQNRDGINPPEWTGGGLLSWTEGGWSSSLNVRYTGPAVFDTGLGNGSFTTTNFSLGYHWKRSPRRENSDGPRITLGIGNLFDADPPFVDNLSGFALGSPMGRTYSVACTVPL